MDKNIFNSIKSRLKDYKFTSLEYTNYEDIKDYDITYNEDKGILLFGYNKEMKLNEYHFASNSYEALLYKISNINKDGIITFIPKEWVDKLKSNGFNMFCLFNDYFNNDINKYCIEDKIEYLMNHECKIASQVTLSCKNQSRGFSGQSEEWMYNWINQKEPSANMCGARDCRVIIHKENNVIVGVVCVGIYGEGSKINDTLWIREIAVDSKYQNKGIGQRLLNKALWYGKKEGAMRSFLTVDELNVNAIKLYKNMGFESKNDDYEIVMIKQ